MNLEISIKQAEKLRETIKKLEREEVLLKAQLEACRSVLKDLEAEIGGPGPLRATPAG